MALVLSFFFFFFFMSPLKLPRRDFLHDLASFSLSFLLLVVGAGLFDIKDCRQGPFGYPCPSLSIFFFCACFSLCLFWGGLLVLSFLPRRVYSNSRRS